MNGAAIEDSSSRLMIRVPTTSTAFGRNCRSRAIASGALTEVTLIRSVPLGHYASNPAAATISAMRPAAARRRSRENRMNASCPTV
jgi:hypothetical protein